MKINSPRQSAIRKAMRKLAPQAPFSDFSTIFDRAKSPHMRDLAPVDAVWLATISHIRHNHTDYDRLRDEGYDKPSARHFVLAKTNEVLAEWQSTRFLDELEK